MRYITAEQFLKQPLDVQEALRVWCEQNLQVYDLVAPIDRDTMQVIDSVCMITQCMDTSKDKINIGRVFYLETCLLFDTIHEIVPLLSLQQLIEFIEDKTQHKVSISPSIEGKYYIGYDKYSKNEDGDLKRLVYTECILEGAWKVACKVAEEVAIDETDNACLEKE